MSYAAVSSFLQYGNFFWAIVINALLMHNITIQPAFLSILPRARKKRFVPLVVKFKDAFKDESDVWMILNHILNVMLDFAVKVHNGQMSGSEDYSEHVFRVIYH